MVLDDITWETTETYDVGIDVNFLNDRLRITADYYKKTARDMLILVDIPSYLGYTAPYKNLGRHEHQRLGTSPSRGATISATISATRSP